MVGSPFGVDGREDAFQFFFFILCPTLDANSHLRHQFSVPIEVSETDFFVVGNPSKRPTVTISSCHDYSDNCFSFTSTLADAMRSMDVSRSLDSLLSHPRFPYRVPSARVLVRFPFRFTCSLTCTNMDCRLVCLCFSLMLVSFCLVDSSALTDTAYAYPL